MPADIERPQPAPIDGVIPPESDPLRTPDLVGDDPELHALLLGVSRASG